jgi:hypothetical protein
MIVADLPIHELSAQIGGVAIGFASPAEKFRALAADWTAAQAGSSTVHVEHPAYQQIIGMGASALPMLLDDLERTGRPWYWALKCIAGADPVPEADRGRAKRMIFHWLAWGRGG